MKYETLVKNVIDAIKNDINTVNKWQIVGSGAREFFGSEAALLEIKAQFIADAVLPALDKKHAAALSVELPRKGSKEYNALDAAAVEKWKVQNQAKKDARSTADTMFARVVKYAFPAEKVESETETKTTKTKIVNLINDAIGKAEKDTTPDYDAVVLIQQLRAALATASK
jgi:hypothetical protein